MDEHDLCPTLSEPVQDEVEDVILPSMDVESIRAAELVCEKWASAISEGNLCKRFIEKKCFTDSRWQGLCRRRQWHQHMAAQMYGEKPKDPPFYKDFYLSIIRDIEQLESNWSTVQFSTQEIRCESGASKGVYCLQFDEDKIVCGLKDHTIKIWDRANLQCVKVLTGHTASVLCLQYDENNLISGGSDATIRLWDLRTGALRSTMFHKSRVLNLRFRNGMVVSCSKHPTVTISDVRSGQVIFRRLLVGHAWSVNDVDFDRRYIVSGSGDKTIKVWKTSTCELLRTLRGHTTNVVCVQYRDDLIVSGSWDHTIRLWNIESGVCLRVLEGHESIVRCIRFDRKRIVSGDYNGRIKLWNLRAALDPAASADALCRYTILGHSGRVYSLQLDDFQIVTCSHDDTIVIRDFLNVHPPQRTSPPARSSSDPLQQPSSSGSMQ